MVMRDVDFQGFNETVTDDILCGFEGYFTLIGSNGGVKATLGEAVEPTQTVVLTEGFARGMTLSVNAYGKKWMNESAYAGYPMKSCKAAKTVDLAEFNRRILADFE